MPNMNNGQCSPPQKEWKVITGTSWYQFILPVSELSFLLSLIGFLVSALFGKPLSKNIEQHFSPYSIPPAVVGHLTNNIITNSHDLIRSPYTIHNHNLPELASPIAK